MSDVKLTPAQWSALATIVTQDAANDECYALTPGVSAMPGCVSWGSAVALAWAGLIASWEYDGDIRPNAAGREALAKHESEASDDT